jgi:mevalonate kinase
MMSMRNAEKKMFFAKVLLFGEYSVIFDGEAVTIPLKHFSGYFELPADTNGANLSEKESNKNLIDFFSYLSSPEINKKFQFQLDLQRLDEDLSRGMYFNSNIPQGYGAGSSGAMVAAVFDHYSIKNPVISENIKPKTLDLVRQQLALMESYFHGSSSGLDPLSSLLGKPFRMDGQKRISFPGSSLFSESLKKDVFLIDTGHAGDTRPLVNWFKEQVDQKVIDAELLKALNNQVVQALLHKNELFFDGFLAQLSLFQLENMKPMIPESIGLLWQKGINSGDWTLKLCGSGGGGFVLGFTDDYSKTKKEIEESGFNTTVLF